jgi:hypothetical protein
MDDMGVATQKQPKSGRAARSTPKQHGRNDPTLRDPGTRGPATIPRPDPAADPPLETGKHADSLGPGANPLEAEPAGLTGIKVLATVLGGTPIHRRGISRS